MFRTPGEASRAFAGEIGAGNLDAAVRCLASHACFVSLDGTPTSGRNEIRPILAQMIAADTRIEIEESSVLIGDDIALGSERWRIHFRGVNGTPFRQASPAKMVLRRLAKSWALVIAAPWGWGEYEYG